MVINTDEDNLSSLILLYLNEYNNVMLLTCDDDDVLLVSNRITRNYCVSCILPYTIIKPGLHEPFSVIKLEIVNAVHSDTANHGR